MALLSFVLLAALVDLPPVEIETLKGERQSGVIAELSGSTLRMRQGERTVDIPLADVLEVRFPQAAVPEPSAGSRVVLVDGTQLTCREFTVRDGQARLVETAQCGTLTVPVAAVAEVRFGISTARLDEGWNALRARESKTDLLVVKKDDVLDHLGGVTGDVGEKIGFLLDGDEVPVARERVYGIFFRRRPLRLPAVTCRVALSGGDALQGVQTAWDGERFRVKLAVGVEVPLAAGAVSSIDYSAGKVRFLSQIEPRDVKYVPYFDLVYEYRRDRNLDGGPISLAGKTYARGLAIHSRTLLRYRIGGEFSRLQAIVGIDDSVRWIGRHVKVVITGDGKPLFDSEVSGKDPPRPLDLDVAGVRDIEILVDFGSDGGEEGDHLDLANAKLLK
jgi:hypothetical protein